MCDLLALMLVLGVQVARSTAGDRSDAGVVAEEVAADGPCRRTLEATGLRAGAQHGEGHAQRDAEDPGFLHGVFPLESGRWMQCPTFRETHVQGGTVSRMRGALPRASAPPRIR